MCNIVEDVRAAGDTSWVWTLKDQKQVAGKAKQEFPQGSPQVCWRRLGGAGASLTIFCELRVAVVAKVQPRAPGFGGAHQTLS